MNMKADSVFKCVKPYSGRNSKGKPFTMARNSEYSKTEVNMSSVDSTRNDVMIFLNEWNTPRMMQLPPLTADEFRKLESEYLVKVTDLK